MRPTWLFFICFGLLTVASVGQQSPQLMSDPLFGISYDPAKVVFEKAPESITRFCSDLRGRKLWVYGRSKTTTTEYFIVSGFRKFYPDGPGPAGTEPDFGIAVALQGKHCTVDQSEFFLRAEVNPAKGATPIKVPDAVLRNIAADALNRYAKAFGGKKQFLQLLTQNDRTFIPPVLRRQLELFENSGPVNIESK